MFKDSHAFCKTCENYQKLGSISKRHMMPLNPILVIEIFDCWGIDFMGPFPPSFGFLYILVAVDYVSKWIETIPSRNNDHKTLIKILKENILSRFGIPHTLNESFICHDWQQIRDLTSHQSMTTFLMNPYFLSLQYLGLLILIIFLFQDICQLTGAPKTKESSWTKWRTFIGMTLIYSNIILIKYFEDAFMTMR